MSIDAMKQALALICSARLCEINSMSSRQEMLRLMIEATDTLRAAIEEEEFWVKTGEEEQETVTYDTGGFELEARFYSAAELREMIKALDDMNASVRRMMGEI